MCLVIASDHGMTHGGNHGGASYEETDALALFICKRTFSNPNIGKAFQVDLVPTLAMLLGVPIPKNSVGVLLPQLFDTLPAGERLRVLEVNAWQILKLLRVRYPKAPCISSICSGETLMDENNIGGEITEFCHLLSTAESLHESWRDSACNRKNGSCNSADWEVVSKAYLLFLRAASDWLARGTTEKNAILIYSGGCLIFLSTVFFLAISLLVNRKMCNASKTKGFWRFKPENWIMFVGVIGHALSFNSSSLVEEEQFTLHFVLVTMWCLFLRRTYQKRSSCQASECPSYRLLCNLLPSSRRYPSHGDTDILKRSNSGTCHREFLIKVFAAVLVLISARLLQGWHRGGVNWAHLSDIAKWLEQSNPSVLLASHVVSLTLVVLTCCSLVLEQRTHILMQQIVASTFIVAAIFIELYNLRTHGGTVGHNDRSSITIAQLVYTILGGTTLAVLLVSPFCFRTRTKHLIMAFPEKSHSRVWQASVNFIGKVSISCWCLLQLLLQQPVNSVPVLLLLLQLICCLIFFKLSGPTVDFWMKFVTLYVMGSSGHFGMGNTNTLATVDVAGAYIGLNQHSIFLSGLLAFVITYAAPLLYMLGVLLMVSLAEVDASVEAHHGSRGHFLFETIALSCNIPLLLSSVILLSFTLVMLLMQGHLFIWSVFSPKYIYICFTVLSTYWGVTLNALASLYIYMALSK
ncbi:hypothetical protein L7F22_038122 [Adiantum nelumboides]|nr:hypothetical protein [Adiantum nelumboides]